ncbi:MAG TPA: DUF3592 domain-containing protein [Pseudonocardia sp.]|jgi:hypothetical protein
MSSPAPVQTGGAPRGRGRLLDEAAGLSLPVVMPLIRRLPAMILVLGGLITLMGVLVMVGAHKDDLAIDRHVGVATAEVLPGSSFNRTLIRYATEDGASVLPENGVFYPRDLQPGQIVRVEYDRADPDRVRVLGRTASVGWLPLSLMVVGTWVVLLPLAFTLRGRQLRRMEDAAAKAVQAHQENRAAAAAAEEAAAAESSRADRSAELPRAAEPSRVPEEPRAAEPVRSAEPVRAETPADPSSRPLETEDRSAVAAETSDRRAV